MVAVTARALIVLGLALGVEAGWGKKEKQKEGMAGIMDDLAEDEKNLAHDDELRAAGARDYEIENLAKHRDGQLNDAELGMANMQQAMKDPSIMRDMAQMMQDPANQAELKKMMSDPAFQAQAKRVAEQMKASGSMPDIAKMMNDPNVMAKAQAMAQQMYGGGGGAGGGDGGAAAELARLRAENAALKGKMEL